MNREENPFLRMTMGTSPLVRLLSWPVSLCGRACRSTPCPLEGLVKMRENERSWHVKPVWIGEGL